MLDLHGRSPVHVPWPPSAHWVCTHVPLIGQTEAGLGHGMKTLLVLPVCLSASLSLSLMEVINKLKGKKSGQ